MGNNFWRLFATFNIGERIDRAICDVLDHMMAEIDSYEDTDLIKVKDVRQMINRYKYEHRKED